MGAPDYPEIHKESFRASSVSDRETRKDSLGFRPYAEAMASFLTNPRTKGPLTVSIEGEWGIGKSSFMLQLQDQLEASTRRRAEGDGSELGKPLVVNFNAWRNDQSEELWASFALEMVRQIRSQLSSWARLAGDCRLFWRRFNWRRGWFDFLRFVVLTLAIVVVALALPALFGPEVLKAFKQDSEGVLEVLQNWGIPFGGIIAYLTAVLTLLSRLRKTIGDPLGVDLRQHLNAPDYTSRLSFIQTFHDDFRNILNAYVDPSRRVYVFIDDLDRCDVPTPARLMQAINLMIPDDERLIFLLGLDREKIAAGLAVGFKDLLPYLARRKPGGSPKSEDSPEDKSFKGLSFGYGFLEKFIQVPFLVPSPGEEKVRDFIKQLSAQGHAAEAAETPSAGESRVVYSRIFEFEEEEDSATVQEIALKVAPFLRNNPRRIKQFLNLFRLRLATSAATGLFHQPNDPDDGYPLTLPQLGKFVVLSLRWPLLISDLKQDTQPLWANLIASTDENRPDVGRWASHPRIFELLRLRKNEGWSMANCDIERLLAVSPAVRLTDEDYEAEIPYGGEEEEFEEEEPSKQ